MTDDELLSFNGFDGMEAEVFIDAVHTRAAKENKSDDDDWKVKYASKGFKGGALRWWAKLDKTNRRDWDWLVTAFLDRWPPVFRGIDGAECERFIADAEQRIADAGKEDDNKWIAKEIPKSFAGAALRWLATVDPQTKADWSLLKQAMLSRWPASAQSDPAVPSVPEPPTAAPPPANAGSATSSLPTVALQGRIRVETEDGQPRGYLSRALGSRGTPVTTTNVTEMLRVSFEGTTSPYELRAENPATGYSLLGIHWQNKIPTDTDCGGVVGMSRGWKSPLVTTYAWSGDPFTKVWDVDQRKRVTLQWTDANGALWDLQPYRDNSDSEMRVWRPKGLANPGTWEKLSFYLELSD